MQIYLLTLARKNPILLLFCSAYYTCYLSITAAIFWAGYIIMTIFLIWCRMISHIWSHTCWILLYKHVLQNNSLSYDKFTEILFSSYKYLDYHVSSKGPINILSDIMNIWKFIGKRFNTDFVMYISSPSLSILLNTDSVIYISMSSLHTYPTLIWWCIFVYCYT